MYSNESYLIELLTQAGYLNEEILQYARSQKSPTQDLVDFLIQANYLTEDVIAQVAADEGYIKQEDIQRLIKFRDNPSDESWIK